ncbi:MAG: hypothetical protein KH009_08020 [Clostridiales bacterium]|nr:hypothetical protein [Clostridiales bacterium]
MNSKKITALALAALMAVGSTGTAFATVNGEALDFGSDKNLYKENGDGVLVEAEADEFAPGDDIYIRLEEAEDLTSKDAKKMNLYATWKVGEENVEDLDIVYKKGEFEENGTLSYTVTLGGKTFVLNANSKTDLVTKVMLAISEELDRNEDFLADEIAEKKAAYLKETGLKVGDIYYADVDALIEGEKFQPLTSKIYVAAGDENAMAGSYDTNSGWGGFEKEIADTTDYYGRVSYKGSGHNFIKKGASIDEVVGAKYYDNNFAVEKVTNDFVKDGKIVTEETVVDAIITDIAKSAVEDKKVVANYDDGYTYWAKISTKDSDTTKTLDLAGDLFIGRSKSSADGKDESAHFALDLTLSNRGNADNGYDYDIEVVDDASIGVDERAVLKFSDDAEDVTLEFGDEIARYEFNAKGQKALNFAFNLDFNKEIAALFPEANLDFITWTAKPSTNKTGTLYIYADEDSFLYEVTDNGIKEVNGAKYDEDEGAWVVRTRKLSAYAIADQELDANKVIEEEKETSSSTESESNNSGKHNPDTGR